MVAKGFLLFHLNLAFSSIAEALRLEVIRNSYYPLLRLAQDADVPIGVELTGWTLREIEKLDPRWLDLFRTLLKEKKCELVGSGYTQLIGPLVPCVVNRWNQRLGLEDYERILGVIPQIVLVSEMAYSNSLVDIYKEAGYEGFVMDRDNVRLALNIQDPSREKVPTHALGTEGEIMPVLWADSILFQRLQHFVHGDIPLDDYVSHLSRRIENGEQILPIYCNDAEIFDYRPGRFTEEANIHHEGEWRRMKRLLETLDQEIGLVWVSPGEAIDSIQTGRGKIVGPLTSILQPIPVKKQAKYNIARWAVTGKNDLWLNTMCHRLHRKFVDDEARGQTVPPDSWRKLCEFWASDLRTHIEQGRWEKMLLDLDAFMKDQNAKVMPVTVGCGHAAEQEGFEISEDDEGIYLSVSSPSIKIVLNLRRGLAVKSLAFISQEFKPLIGSLPHGYFSSISFGADYYSGNLVADLPTERSRTTDLNKVKPELTWEEDGLKICANIDTKLGFLQKSVMLSRDQERVNIAYAFESQSGKLGSVRAAAITFLPECLNDELLVQVVNGGKTQEVFSLDHDFDHTAPASSLVSCTSGLGATDGKLHMKIGKQALQFSWDPAKCAAMPMIQHRFNSDNNLLRLFFSLGEVDDTAAAGKDVLPFDLTIEPK